MLDDHAHDLPLARLLNELARLPMPTIQGLLGEVRATAGGPTLARALVSRGLLTVEEVEGLLARLGGAAAAPAPGGVPASLERIGEYRLLRRIGSGGMGNVYEAEQVTSGARCALKLANVEHDPALRARLQREGEAQARVDAHPNVVRVLSAGEADGRGYLVMELVTGGTLQDRIREQPIEGEAAAEIVAQLADGLHHVHQRGVLHRDLKPANVLFDAEGVPKLVDFGLARVADAQSLTQTGAILGTPAFMSPEQARGVAGAIDARSDVYGLGAVLFACLTGRPPFREPALLAVLAQVIREAPPDPSDLVPGVPAWVEAVCLRALAKDPGERYPDAAALAEALRSPPVAAAARPTRRRAALSWLGAFATVAVACATGAAAYALTRTRPVVAQRPASASSAAPDSVEAGFRAALEAAAQAGSAADVAPLASALAALQAERPLRGSELERLRELALDPVGPPALGPLVGALAPDDGSLQAALLKRFGQVDLEGPALRALARSYQVVGERAAALAPASAGLSVALARCDLLLDAERWEEANRLVERLFADPRCDSRVRSHLALRRGRLRWVALQVEAARVDFEVSSGLGGPLEAFAWRAIALEAEGRQIVAVRWALHFLRQADPSTSAHTARLFRRVALLVYWAGARLGDQASRVAAADRVVAAFPGSQHAGWRVRLAYLHGRLGDVTRCRAALEVALTRVQGGQPLADLRPGLVAALTLLQRGDRDGVQRLRAVAVELDERAGLGRSFTP